jgi:hypothetical protein
VIFPYFYQFSLYWGPRGQHTPAFGYFLNNSAIYKRQMTEMMHFVTIFEHFEHKFEFNFFLIQIFSPLSHHVINLVTSTLIALLLTTVTPKLSSNIIICTKFALIVIFLIFSIFSPNPFPFRI